MASPEDLPQEEREMWEKSDLEQPGDSLSRTSTQEHFRQAYFLPNLEDVEKTIKDNMKKNQARAIKRGRSAMANPPSREP